MKKISKEQQEKLNMLNQTRPRYPSPRATTFADKTKYSRNREKEKIRKEISDF